MTYRPDYAAGPQPPRPDLERHDYIPDDDRWDACCEVCQLPKPNRRHKGSEDKK